MYPLLQSYGDSVMQWIIAKILKIFMHLGLLLKFTGFLWGSSSKYCHHVL